jgi:hypothetical protein
LLRIRPLSSFTHERRWKVAKLYELTPEQRLRFHGVIVERDRGWVVMDRLGECFLGTACNSSCLRCEGWFHILGGAFFFPTRRAAREAYAVWYGKPLPPGRKKTNPLRKPENNDQARFERKLGCLMHLWKMYPSAITLDSVQLHVHKLMKRQFGQRAFRRDMEALVRFGYAIKLGPTYTAVPEFRRWWSDEFGDGKTPRSGA